MVRSEDHFRRGQVEHVLTMTNLKLKPFLFTPRPSTYPDSSDWLPLRLPPIMQYCCEYWKVAVAVRVHQWYSQSATFTLCGSSSRSSCSLPSQLLQFAVLLHMTPMLPVRGIWMCSLESVL